MDPGFCAVPNLQIEFWCYEDEVPLCLACRLNSHHQHEVLTRYTDKIKEQLRQLSEAVDKMVDLVEGMKGTSKAIEERRKLLLSKQKFFKLQVKNPHCPPFHSFN